MSEMLDSTLAGLAGKLGVAAAQIGPETVKAYGGALQAQSHVLGWCLFLSLLVTACLVVAAKVDDYGGEGWAIGAIVSGILSAVATVFYSSAVIELAAYTASPVGATVAHFMGR